ncbi:uncharacterized protein LOC143986708 isoform X5 [Lithobates pipiens]
MLGVVLCAHCITAAIFTSGTCDRKFSGYIHDPGVTTFEIPVITPSYSRHPLTVDSGAQHAKEILIWRQQSLQATLSKYKHPYRKQSYHSGHFYFWNM